MSKATFSKAEVDDALPLLSENEVEILVQDLKKELLDGIQIWQICRQSTGQKKKKDKLLAPVMLTISTDCTEIYIREGKSEKTKRKLWERTDWSGSLPKSLPPDRESAEGSIVKIAAFNGKIPSVLPLHSLEQIILGTDSKSFTKFASLDCSKYIAESRPDARRFCFVLEFGSKGTANFVACSLYQYLRILYGLPRVLKRPELRVMPLTKEETEKREFEHQLITEFNAAQSIELLLRRDDDELLECILDKRNISANMNVKDGMTILDLAYEIIEAKKCRETLRKLGAGAPRTIDRCLSVDDDTTLLLYLREQDIDVLTWRDDDGASLLDLAIFHRCPKCREVMRRAGTPIIMAMEKIWERDDAVGLRTIIDELPGDPSDIIFREHLLEHSLRAGAKECYACLLTNGADVLKVSTRAVTQDEVDMLKLLETEDPNFDLNVTNQGGETLLDLAIARRSKACRDFLRAKGASTCFDLTISKFMPKKTEATLTEVELRKVQSLSSQKYREVFLKAKKMLEHEVSQTLGEELKHAFKHIQTNSEGVFITTPILFEAGQIKVTPNGREIVNELKRFLTILDITARANWSHLPYIKVQIVGHANTPSNIHSEETYNQSKEKELSFARARAVMDAILVKGVLKHVKLVCQGRGGEEPLVEGGSTSNCRAEVSLELFTKDVKDALVWHMLQGREHDYNAYEKAIKAAAMQEKKVAEAEQTRALARETSQKELEAVLISPHVASISPESGKLSENIEGALEKSQKNHEGALVQPCNLSLFSTASLSMPRGFGRFAPGFLVLGEQNTCLLEDGFTREGGSCRLSSDVPDGALSPRSVLYTKHSVGKWQFFGNCVPLRRGQIVRMSCWIKFLDTVPPPSVNFGFKRHLPHVEVDSSWLSNCIADLWILVEKQFLVEETGCDLLLLIFDTLPVGQALLFTDLSYFVAPQNPDKEIWYDERANISRSLAYSLGSLEFRPQLTANGIYRTAVARRTQENAVVKEGHNATTQNGGEIGDVNDDAPWKYILRLADGAASDE